MNIGIFLDNTNNNWGPGKLALNTIKGFKKMGINFKVNEPYDYNLCISGSQYHWRFFNNSIKNSIIGPCSIDDSRNHGASFAQYSKFLVPSQWHKNLWISQGVSEEKVNVWFGGIDSDLFKPNKNLKYDCLILFKNRSYQDLSLIQSKLSSKNLSFVTLTNGTYDEETFIQLANNCKFCIILHNTETQGFATMEIMSMDLPVIVFDFNVWENQYFEASSVPYFNPKCGIIVKQENFNSIVIEEKINEMLDNLTQYSPRDLILENYTLTHSINLLKKYFEEEWK